MCVTDQAWRGSADEVHAGAHQVTPSTQGRHRASPTVSLWDTPDARLLFSRRESTASSNLFLLYNKTDPVTRSEKTLIWKVSTVRFAQSGRPASTPLLLWRNSNPLSHPLCGRHPGIAIIPFVFTCGVRNTP